MSFISPIPVDANGQQRTTGGMQSLGKNDFLKLLISKLQNQDPLKPMDDENFIAQLAQFSSLEQMNNISSGIDKSNNLDFLQMQSLNNVMASGLIGKDVKATYSSIYVDQQNKPDINYTLKSPADKITFVIKDEQGNVVNTLYQEHVAIGQNTLVWDGTDKMGNAVPEGNYSIEATATDPSGATFKPDMSLAGKVESVIYRNGSAYLRVNGTEVPLGAITAVGEPGAYTDSANSDGGSDW
ncbi:MAG: hypothetical protein GXO93_02290 [FCB group bacterium]|nr:hypothetical protein [FCB group bacterium]